MTELLQQVFAQIIQLSPEQQDAISLREACANATRFLAELQDEQKWKTSFATTTDEQWDQMAALYKKQCRNLLSILFLK